MYTSRYFSDFSASDIKKAHLSVRFFVIILLCAQAGAQIRSGKEKVLNQYFDSETDEHGAAEEFGFRLIFSAKNAANLNSCGGNHERGAADDCDCLPNIHLKERKCNADGKRVNARCHRNHKHAHKRER